MLEINLSWLFEYKMLIAENKMDMIRTKITNKIISDKNSMQLRTTFLTILLRSVLVPESARGWSVLPG